MQIVDCNHREHGAAILSIVNDVIASSTALFEYRPRSPDSMTGWFEAKQRDGWPVIAATDGELLLGFATFGTFRHWPAYKYSVEHSVYVERSCRRAGVGSALLGALVAIAEQRNLHLMVAGIDADNAASIALHRRHGFDHAGTVRQAGYKFGRWLDLAFYQRVLSTPLEPKEDES
jgi:L-amino acid N-acyltransferase YncA